MTKTQTKTSLRGFVERHNLAYGTVRNWLISQGYDTSDGLTPEATAAALEHFEVPPTAAMVHLGSGGLTVSINRTQRGDAEDALNRVQDLQMQTVEFSSEELAFSGLEEIEAGLKARLDAAAEKRKQLNNLIGLINDRYVEIRRLRELHKEADAVDAGNDQLEAQIAAEAKKLQEYQAALQSLQR